VVAELHEARGLALQILTGKQVAHALLARRVGENFKPFIAVLAGDRLPPAVELDNVIFNIDFIDVGFIAGRIVGLHLVEGLALILFRLLAEPRVEIAVLQQRINRLPDAVPVGELTIAHVAVGENAVGGLLLGFSKGVPVRVGKSAGCRQRDDNRDG